MEGEKQGGGIEGKGKEDWGGRGEDEIGTGWGGERVR